MDFESYKSEFDKSFAKVTSEDFISDMEKLGYEFENVSSSQTFEPIVFSANIKSEPKGLGVFLSIWEKIFSNSIDTSINWNLPNDLINVYEKGITITELEDEQESIDFTHFKFEQIISEERNFKVRDVQKSFTVKITTVFETEFNTEKTNKEAA